MQPYSYRDSGIEWLGKIPTHWKVKRIKDLVDLRSGEAITALSITEDGDYPVYGGNGLRGYTSAYTHEGQRILIGRQGALCGNVNYASGKFWASEHAVVATPVRLHDTFWFGELLRAMNLNQYSNAAAQPGLAVEKIKNLNISLPPIEEQRAIAGFLDEACGKIDAAIQVKREQIRQNEVILDSVIQHAVTKGLNPDAPLRDSGISWIGNIPTHWQVKKLKRILAEVDYGISESSKPEGKHAVLKMGNIVKGEIAYTKIEYVDTVSPDLILRKDDLLFNRTNSHDQVGKVGIFRDSEEDQVTFASYLVRLRPNHSSNPHYLNHYLNTDAFLGIARKMAIPSVQQANLNPTRYGRLEVAVPPLAEQIEIAAYLDKKLHDIRQVADTLQQQISVLEAYKKSLVHECVTGKKQVWRGG